MSFGRKYKGQMPYYPGDGQEQHGPWLKCNGKLPASRGNPALSAESSVPRFVEYVLEKTDPAVMSAMVNTAGPLPQCGLT